MWHPKTLPKTLPKLATWTSCMGGQRQCRTGLSWSWAGHWNVSQIMMPSREIPFFPDCRPIPLCVCSQACSALGQPLHKPFEAGGQGKELVLLPCTAGMASCKHLCYSSSPNVQVLPGVSTLGTQPEASTVSVLSLFSAVKIWLMSQISLPDVCPECFLVPIQTKRDMGEEIRKISFCGRQ